MKNQSDKTWDGSLSAVDYVNIIIEVNRMAIETIITSGLCLTKCDEANIIKLEICFALTALSTKKAEAKKL